MKSQIPPIPPSPEALAKSLSRIKRGRPRAYTPEEIESKFEEYVRWVEGNPIFIQKVSAGEIIKVGADRPLTIVDFCQFAGISKDTFRRYEDEFCGPLTRIREAIEADQLRGAIVGIYDAGIIGRVLQLADRQDVTTNGKEIKQAPAVTFTVDEAAASIIQSIGKQTINSIQKDGE